MQVKSAAPDDVRYCQRCGHTLELKRLEQTVRPHCAACGYVVFLDPKVAAVVLLSRGGKLVLVRRAIEPALGRWSFPSGYVDRGEAVEDAAVREVKEETGLDARLTALLGVYSQTGATVVLVAYAAEVDGGTLGPGAEVSEAALFAPDDLPPMPFLHDDQILAAWRSSDSRLPGESGRVGV